MQFTYDAYRDMIYSLKKKDYFFSTYTNCFDKNKTVILRHEIDYSIEKAIMLAKVEYDLDVKSTYFVLLTSPFYNLIARDNLSALNKIQEYGHCIGLHFDELNYSKEYYDKHGGIRNVILEEVDLLETITGIDIKAVSMHRPSQDTLNANFDLSPLINSYSSYFFKEFKYISDSRRRWREDIDEIIDSEIYEKLHILTHAFWYNEKEETLKTSISKFVRNATFDRYDILKENISNLEEIVERKELE